MKRHILVLTDAEKLMLLMALDIAWNQDGLDQEAPKIDALMTKVANSLPVTRVAWSALDHAIGNSLQDEPEAVLPHPSSRTAAIRVWGWLRRQFVSE